jgi:hypothetical protein
VVLSVVPKHLQSVAGVRGAWVDACLGSGSCTSHELNFRSALGRSLLTVFPPMLMPKYEAENDAVLRRIDINRVKWPKGVRGFRPPWNFWALGARESC